MGRANSALVTPNGWKEIIVNNRFCVKKSSLTLFFTIAALFHISYVQLSSYYVPFQYTIIICSIAFLAIYVFLNIKSFAVADNIGINILILMFSLSMFWSSYSNSFRGTFDFRYVIINIAKYIFPFLVLQCIQNKEKTRLALKFLYGWALFYCVLSDLHAVLTKANTIGYIGTYIVGNKFNLCYLHFLLLALYFCVFHGKTSIKLTGFHVGLVLFAAIYSECSTGIVGVILILVFIRFKSFFLKLMGKPWFGIAVIAISDSILLLNSAILQLKPVQYFIENILKEDITLTGRMRGYLKLTQSLRESPMFGVGFENNHIVSEQYTGMLDLQNGVADLLLSFGIVGIILVTLIIVFALKKGANIYMTGVLALTFTYMVLSSVEITLNQKFFSILALSAFAFPKYDDYPYIEEEVDECEKR